MAQDPSPSSSHFEVFASGEKFGDYQVMEVLAAGPLAAIYRMQGLAAGKDEIFLVPPPESVRNALLKVRIKESVGRFGRFETPSLWKPEACVEIAGRPCCRLTTRDLIPLTRWMAQQLCRGQEEIAPVGAVLPSFPAGLPVARAKALLVDIAGAVEVAHIAGFKHFTLDPRWVFVGPDGKVALAGFNFAELLGMDLLTLKIRDSIGTTQSGFPTDFDFLAPEVRCGQSGDYSADAYGFGGIVHYILTGQRPTFKMNREGVREATAASTLNLSVPKDWDAFTQALLMEKSFKRPDVFDKLRQQLEQLPVEVEVKAKAKDNAQGVGKGVAVNIPLPQTLSSRLTPKGLALFRALFLALFGVIVVGLGWMSFTIFTDKTASSGLVNVQTIIPTPAGKKPHLWLKFSPGKVMFKIFGPDNLAESFIVNSGQLSLSLPRGTYKVSIQAKDHQTFNLDNVLVDGRETVTRAIRLTPEWGLVELRGTPGAMVVAKRENGEESRHGPIPPEGFFLMDQHLFKGRYTFTIEKPNHDPVVLDKIIVTEKMTQLEAKLKPHPASVTIKSEPVGATVLMDGKEVGSTPLTLNNLPVGRQLEFLIRAPSFRDRKYPVTLEPGDSFEWDIGDLRAALGNLNLMISLGDRPADPADLPKISVMLGSVRLATKGKYEAVPAGKTKIRVDHPDFETYSAEATVLDGEDITVRAMLIPKFGHLRVITDPPVAVSLFNAETQQPLVSEGNNAFRLPPFKQIQVEARANDYETKRSSFTLRANELGEWKLAMKRLAPPVDGSAYTVPAVSLVLNWAPAGSFTFGSPISEQAREPSEGPETTVTFPKGFWAAKYEVTQEIYERVMTAAKRTNPSIVPRPSAGASKLTLNHPVQNVSWEDANRFCRTISEWERASGRLPKGYVYRLPTEAEWEYVARAGSTKPFSFEGIADCSTGQFQGFYPREANSNAKPRFPSTAPVGSFAPNAWGFHDVHGNVREWCQNWFAFRLPGGTVPNWVGPESGKMRSVRGGSWENSAKECRASSRDSRSPENLSSGTGFRPFLAPEL